MKAKKSAERDQGKGKKYKTWRDVLAEEPKSSAVRTISSPSGGQPSFKRKAKRRP